MAVLQAVSDNVEDLINARGRSAGHVLEGLALCAAAIALSAVVAARTSPSARPAREKVQEARLSKPRDAPSKSAVAAMWPTLVLVLTLSGLRVWNAPASAERTRALGLWAAIQGLNALWMAWPPKRQTAQLATSALTLGAGAVYANEARKVDGTAAALVSPYLGWSSLAGLVTAAVWTRNKGKAGVS